MKLSSSSGFKEKIFEYFDTQFSTHISDFFNLVGMTQLPPDVSALYLEIFPEAHMVFDGAELGIVAYFLSDNKEVIEIEGVSGPVMENREPTCTPSIELENLSYKSEEKDEQYVTSLLFTVENLMLYLGEVWHAKERQIPIKLITHIHDSHTSYDIIKKEWIEENY